jgi:glycosyltransferase involved in cell wall biosynthesis
LPSDWLPSVSVVMTVHNGAADLARKLEQLLAHDYPSERLDVVVVTDGSTDATDDILSRFEGPRVRVLYAATRRGKSACLADAIGLARGDVLVDEGAIRALVAPLGDAHIGAVSGELVFEQVEGYAAAVDAYWRYEKWIRRNEARSGSVMGVTGALYAVRRADMPRPPPGLVLDDLWVPLQLIARGLRVIFSDDARVFDRPSRDARAESTRKRRTLAGNWQLIAMWPGLVIPGASPAWWRLIGHKFLRLIVPMLLLIAFASNAHLARDSAFYAVLALAQVVAYVIAGLGVALPSLRRWLPVRLVSAFAEMNVYAVLGFVDFLRQRAPHLWQASTAGAVR